MGFLLLTGNTLNLMSLIGMVMLMGLVTKNSILLVDYTNLLRSKGKERDEAILEAGPVRMRPILMTAISTIAGVLPVGRSFISRPRRARPSPDIFVRISDES